MIYKCIYPENIEEGSRNLFLRFFYFFIHSRFPSHLYPINT